MYFPLISKISNAKCPEPPTSTRFYRRKGAGGGGGGGGGSGARRRKKHKGGPRSAGSLTAGGTTHSASSFGKGGGPQTTIPSGQIFAGRSQGGGTRDQVYGTKQYGSRYPGTTTRGVGGRGFPFYFWPVPWVGAAGAAGAIGGGAYLYNHEYGKPDNTSRPGGVMITSAFRSVSANNTFRLLADRQAYSSLLEDITVSCGSLFNASTIAASSYSESSNLPKPEQVVQYYRASSVALALDGYNNTAVLETEGTPDVALPSGVDVTLLNCLNSTIGTAIPLVDYGNSSVATTATTTVSASAALSRVSTPSILGLVCLLYLLRCLFPLR